MSITFILTKRRRRQPRVSSNFLSSLLLAASLSAVFYIAIFPSAVFAQQPPPPRVTIALPPASVQATPTPTPTKAGQQSEPLAGGVKSQSGGARDVGSLTGRVVSEDGQPLAGATVYIASPGGAPRPPQIASTDEEGKFRVDNLEPAAYMARAIAPGYVMMPDPLIERGERVYYRVGDFVHLTMTKGGVITGTVTDENGEPAVALRMRAVYLRDLDGRTQPSSGAVYGMEHQTDDRGVYRIYGLAPGIYLVGTGGSSRFPGFWFASEKEIPIYYPSSSRDAASEVTVRAGQEVSGVDIRYRAELGHTISGKVEGTFDLSDMTTGVSISLTHTATGMTEYGGFNGRNADRSFKFDAVADGDYELAARYISRGDSLLASPPLRVSLRGMDVLGLTLKLASLAKVGGRVQLDSTTHADSARQKNDCAGKRADAATPREVAVILRRDPREDSRIRMRFPRYDTMPDAQGDFSFRNLEPGRYRLDAAPPGADWYVSSLTLPANSAATSQTQTTTGTQTVKPSPAASTRAPSATATTASDWLVVNPGDALTNLSIRLAFGAASLRGQLVATEDGARFSNPAQFRVYLVPANTNEADAPLRFAESPVTSDGAFAFSNLAPGRYRLLARPLSADASQEVIPRPAAWEKQGRASLLREAEAANISVELQPCQRLDGFSLRQK